RKFDEIVAFAEVEQFLDTPVKHYSSGMYVRLAFAVAAHLEPEILLVDEVLAVGDASFQKKSMGRLNEVAGQGRTVVFVSHNMAAVKSLTHRAAILNAGQVAFLGPTDLAIKKYGAMTGNNQTEKIVRSLGRGAHTAIRSVQLLNELGTQTSSYGSGSPLRV